VELEWLKRLGYGVTAPGNSIHSIVIWYKLKLINKLKIMVF
jgi:hypothetical protein